MEVGLRGVFVFLGSFLVVGRFLGLGDLVPGMALAMCLILCF